MTDKTIPFSVLDLAPIPQGSSAREAFSHSLDLAQLAEKRGYHRYWLAEHHNMVGIASAATSVLIGYLAANTTTLHLGSGGVMLPNHAPLVIAEQFGTLNTLYPGRIDLGLGRAPGSDQPTMRALRRHMSGDIDNFPRDVADQHGGRGTGDTNHIVVLSQPVTVITAFFCQASEIERVGKGFSC